MSQGPLGEPQGSDERKKEREREKHNDNNSRRPQRKTRHEDRHGRYGAYVPPLARASQYASTLGSNNLPVANFAPR